MVFMFQYNIIICNSQLRKILKFIEKQTNYFENDESDSDDDMVSDVRFNNIVIMSRHYWSLSL